MTPKKDLYDLAKSSESGTASTSYVFDCRVCAV